MEDKKEEPRREGKGDGFSAYYYAFNTTKCTLVDNILKAVAGAGASFHHTDNWMDEEYTMSPRDSIQLVAEESAAEITLLKAQLDETHIAHGKLIGQTQTLIQKAREEGAKEMAEIAARTLSSYPSSGEEIKIQSEIDNFIELWREQNGK